VLARQVHCSFVGVFSVVFFGFGDVGVSTGITRILVMSYQNFSDGLLIALAFVRQRELDPPVEAGSL
jgi:hypothetical protein